MTSTTYAGDVATSIVREAPDVEAYKLGLLADAELAADQPLNLPAYQVAGMSQNQLDAIAAAEAAAGGYQPYIEYGGYTLGDAQTALGGVMSGAVPYQTEALGMMQTAAQNIPAQTVAAQQGIAGALDYGAAGTDAATQNLGAASENARLIAAQSAADQLAAYDAIPGQIGAAQGAMAGAGMSAANVADLARQGGQGQVDALAQNLAGATEGARTYGAMGQGALESQQLAQQNLLQASDQARQQALAGQQGLVSSASNVVPALQQAGALGTGAALEGIAGLAGTTGQFDPSSVGSFMNQYEDAAVQQALADIQRAGDIQQQQVGAQAVGAGAFGGSRQAVQEAEVARNVLEQQGRTAAGMRQAGFEQAANRAQQAYEAQQARGQQAAQLTGALGAQGAQTGLQAAQAEGQMGMAAAQQAAQLGLSAEQLAQAGAGQLGQQGIQAAQVAGQLGLSGEQMASANAQALAQTGMNLEQLAANTGMNAAQLAGQLGMQSGQLGLQGAQTQAQIAGQAGQTALSAEQMAQQAGMQQGQLAQGQTQLGIQGAQAAGGIGLQGQQQLGQLAQGIGGLGTQYGQLGLAQGEALGTLGLRQGAMGELAQNLGQKDASFLFDIGKQQQAQQQAVLEAKRQTDLQNEMEAFQRLGFRSDIYKGAPSTQMSVTTQSSPQVSPAQQILGLGIAGLGAYGAAQKGGLF